MVPRKFNIVDFGGFDLAGQYGEILPGIYDKIVDAHWNCVYIMCFGLKFGGFDIAPQYMTPEMFADHIMLNGIISIDQNDAITVPGIEPPVPLPVIIPGTFEENGTFIPPIGVDAYAPVTVNVGGWWKPLKEYIESSGTQYINTGYIVKDTTRFEVVANVQRSQPKTYPVLFGSRPANTAIRTCAIFTNSSTMCRAWGNASDYTVSGSEESAATFGAKVMFQHEKTCTEIITMNGQVSGGIYPASSDPDLGRYPIYIFAVNGSTAPRPDSYCVAKLYAFKVYESDSLVMDLQPYLDDGEACLRDSLTGTLYKNAGTGAFVYGADT